MDENTLRQIAEELSVESSGTNLLARVIEAAHKAIDEVCNDDLELELCDRGINPNRIAVRLSGDRDLLSAFNDSASLNDVHDLLVASSILTAHNNHPFENEAAIEKLCNAMNAIAMIRNAPVPEILRATSADLSGPQYGLAM